MLELIKNKFKRIFIKGLVKTSCVCKSSGIKTTHYVQQYKLKKHTKESAVSKQVPFVKRIWELFKN